MATPTVTTTSITITIMTTIMITTTTTTTMPTARAMNHLFQTVVVLVFQIMSIQNKNYIVNRLNSTLLVNSVVVLQQHHFLFVLRCSMIL